MINDDQQIALCVFNYHKHENWQKTDMSGECECTLPSFSVVWVQIKLCVYDFFTDHIL